MGFRITTWNVNGIRNPFGYQPWRQKRTYAAMFDILEADIVIFQETKIQRKDLTDDMVLVPGWDCFFSLPRHKKGYSGVAIYTRQSSCVPIRAEEGITGALSPLGSTTPFICQASDNQIGGYPSSDQLALSTVDALTLDAEGRAVVLEFPAFVLIGTYIPANSDGSRSDFRQSFIDMLDVRIRNLVDAGKNVVLAGDLNISREELDVANSEASMRKNGLDGEEYVSTPARRVLNQLLEGGRVIGKPDAGREHPVMHDICRALHPKRKGMFTCWEQKVNARPANCGARIDYILCTLAMKDLIADANIQEGLMGSDHCPVYVDFKENLVRDGHEYYLKDEVNPLGMFVQGYRKRDFSRDADSLPLSGRLIPEFSGRRNIRDMFTRKPSQPSPAPKPPREEVPRDTQEETPLPHAEKDTMTRTYSQIQDPTENGKGGGRGQGNSPVKRAKISSQQSRGQSDIKSFFGSKSSASQVPRESHVDPSKSRTVASAIPNDHTPDDATSLSGQALEERHYSDQVDSPDKTSSTSQINMKTPISTQSQLSASTDVYDAVQSRDSWSKLFTKPIAPRCEGHEEPCVSLLTKKPGINLGRSFWMCPRPLGPSGAKEKHTQWRCQTFIWCSDWNARASDGS